MADNNYCACNSGESKYTIKLNQQGPAGKKGEQGDKGLPGFSPYISVVQSDDENYILRINNEANSYNTPNLFPKDQVTTWTNNIEAQVQQLQAEINTKANLTLDNINVANPFNLNGLYINTDPVKRLVYIGDRYAQNILVTYDGLNIKNDNYYDIDISNTSGISVQHKNNKTVLFSLSNDAFEYKNETIATQPWVEKQLDGFLTDLPVATTTTAGIVKPDGTTVTINADGVISAVGEVSQQELADGLALKVNLTDYNNRVGSLESTVGEQAQTIATLQENNTRLLEMINTLKDRVTALETMIDGGNA